MPAFRDAVMWLDSIPAPTERRIGRAAPAPRLVLRRGRMASRVIVAPADQPVRIENRDAIYHLPFARTPDGERSVGAVRGGSPATLEVPAHGVMCLYCRIHSEEQWWIRGVPNHAWAHVDRWGRFELPAVPDGHYVLHAWHPTFGETSTRIEIRGAHPAEVALRY